MALCLTSPLAFASTPASISDSVVQDLRHRKSQSFDLLLSSWEKRYGTQVVPALLGIARDRSAEDSERYVAIMGVAKIGGRQSAPWLSPLLSDPSWMIRNATLRALSALKDPKTASAVLPLVNDPALVIRLEAVESLDKLRPSGSVHALLSAIQSPANYHAGRAQWVPQKALEILRRLKAQNSLTASENREATTRLNALLAHPSKDQKDPSLKPEIEATLRILTRS